MVVPMYHGTIKRAIGDQAALRKLDRAPDFAPPGLACYGQEGNRK
jgi:hypothetical protein